MSISTSKRMPTKQNLRQVSNNHGLLDRRYFTMVEVHIQNFQELLAQNEIALAVGAGGASVIVLTCFHLRAWAHRANIDANTFFSMSDVALRRFKFLFVHRCKHDGFHDWGQDLP